MDAGMITPGSLAWPLRYRCPATGFNKKNTLVEFARVLLGLAPDDRASRFLWDEVARWSTLGLALVYACPPVAVLFRRSGYLPMAAQLTGRRARAADLT